MKKIIKVPYIDQTEKWPTGCESVSTTMLLQYLGLNVSVDEFIKYLPKCDIHYEEGKMIAGNPNECFIGSPYDADSYGCYPKVIVRTVNEIFKKHGLSYEAQDATGMQIEQLIEKYLDKDMPVIFWITINLKSSYKGPWWRLTGSEAEFMWTSNEHCMLLVGYDEDNLYFNDPWHNHGVVGYDKELVLKRHKEMFEMAVVCR